ncbi:MAG: hypothetical protein DCC75_05660 [Proteobacteria bacterium]|nr:MAG: hypothetical protein DCC75_05660 [Pseudomonadota bacterium]
MPIRQEVSHEFKIATQLGSGCILVDFLTHCFFPAGNGLMPGHIVLFAALSALNSLQVLLLAVITLSFEFLIFEVPLGRAAALPVVLALASLLIRKFRSIPPFVAVGVTGMLGYPIVTRLLPWEFEHTHHLLIWSMSDSAAAILTGTFLLSATLYSKLTGRAPLLLSRDYLIHALALFSAALSVFSWLIAHEWSLSVTEYFISKHQYMWMAWYLTALLLPWILGELLALVVTARAQSDLLSDGLFTQRAGGLQLFSGALKDFWRRKTDQSEAQSLNYQTKSKREEAPDTNTSSEQRGLCALTRDGTILFMNQAFRELAQAIQNEVVGKNIAGIAMNKDIQSHLEGLLSHLPVQAKKVTELKISGASNQNLFMQISLHLPDGFDGSLPQAASNSVIVEIQDITGKRSVSASSLAGQKTDALRGLISGVAHAFSNSLTSITGHASVAKLAFDQKQIQEALEHILRASQNASTLLRHLLEFVHSGRSGLESQDLKESLQQRLEFLRRAAGENFPISFNCSVEKAPVSCSFSLIMQALLNLVLNARDSYRPDSGPISICLDQEEIDQEVAYMHSGVRPGRFIRLRVRDQGCGMPPETLAALLDPVRAPDPGGMESALTNGQVGSGLAAVFAIIRSHDGFLTAESHLGKGSTISLYLPVESESIYQNDSRPEIAALQAQQGSPHASEILVVEDDDNIRKVVVCMLESLGYRSSSCSCAEDALDLCRQRSFDLVLVDMVMPKMSGLALLKHLRREFPGLQLLLMTGYGSTVDAAPAGLSVLAKPFDMDLLGQTVGGILGKVKQEVHANV